MSDLLVDILPPTAQRDEADDRGGSSPGKRTMTREMTRPSPGASLEHAREKLAEARGVHLPQLRLAIASRAFEAARIAAANLRAAFTDASRDLHAAGKDRDSKSERDALAAETRELREEAEPLLAQAPPPSPGFDNLAPWELIWGPAGDERDREERATEETWKARLEREQVEERETKKARDEESARLEVEPDETKRDRGSRVDLIGHHLAEVFTTMEKGAEDAREGLGTPPQGKPSTWANLLDLATTAAIAASGAFVATRVATTLLALKGVSEKTVGDAIKDPFKKAVRAGTAARGEVDDHQKLVRAFFEAHRAKLAAGKAGFKNHYWLERREELYRLELGTLGDLAAHATELAQDQEIRRRQERETTVEWVNFVAQAHHGADTDETADSRNIDGFGIWDHMDKDQRPLNEDMHGVLEIHLFMYPNRTFARYTDHSDHGIRIDGVSGYVREQLRTIERVGDAPINKVISIWHEGASSLNPPKPGYQLMVTADGAIGWTSGDAELDEKAKAFADSLPLDIL